MSTAIALPETLDLKASGPLKQAFVERRGQDIEVHADQVRRPGRACADHHDVEIPPPVGGYSGLLAAIVGFPFNRRFLSGEFLKPNAERF